MVEAATTPANAPGHAATEWLRRGIGPLAFVALIDERPKRPGFDGDPHLAPAR